MTFPVTGGRQRPQTAAARKGRTLAAAGPTSPDADSSSCCESERDAAAQPEMADRVWCANGIGRWKTERQRRRTSRVACVAIS